MKIRYHILLWLTIGCLLTLFFGKSLNGYTTAFYFTMMLMPIVIGTTYFFNLHLVPRYLLNKKYVQFYLYLFYTLVISLYLEMMVITISFIILANYQYDQLSPIFYDVFLLAIILYFIVFVFAFISLLIDIHHKQQEMSKLKQEKSNLEKEYITLRVNRKNQRISPSEIQYVESLNDYVKVHLAKEKTMITKEKISSLEKNLPPYFIRIHRSFLINAECINSFNKEEVNFANVSLPISRTYKSRALEKLNKNAS